MQIVPLLCLAPVLMAVAYFDLKYMRIPNWLVYIALALFVVTVPLIGWEEAGLRFLAGLLIFAIGVASFAMGWFGGGDVKMLAALVLFVPSPTYYLFAFGFSAAMLIGVSFVLMLRAAPGSDRIEYKGLQARGKFPMGISIAGAGLAHPFLISAIA